MSVIRVGDVSLGAGHPLVLIAGPCVVEHREVMTRTAGTLKEICAGLDLPLIFKSSFEKDNRTSADAFRGPGLERGLEALARVKEAFELPILSDVHRTGDVVLAAVVLDMLQVPAFLCRQTSLLEAVAVSTRPINLKKGQFMSPEAMSGAVDKVFRAGGPRSQVMITERGSSFGHDRVMCDVTAIPRLQALGCPVALDAGHAAPERRLIPTLARAGVAAGADALFVECHPDPSAALCDGDRMLDLDQMREMLPRIVALARAARASDGVS